MIVDINDQNETAPNILIRKKYLSKLVFLYHQVEHLSYYIQSNIDQWETHTTLKHILNTNCCYMSR